MYSYPNLKSTGGTLNMSLRQIMIPALALLVAAAAPVTGAFAQHTAEDRKSTRLNSSHLVISYAVFCLKKKKTCILSKTAVQRMAHKRDGTRSALGHTQTASSARNLHRPTLQLAPSPCLAHTTTHRTLS